MPRDGRPFRPLNCRRFMCRWRISNQPSLGNGARDRMGDELCHAAIGAPLSTNPLTGSVSAVEWSTRSHRSFESALKSGCVFAQIVKDSGESGCSLRTKLFVPLRRQSSYSREMVL